MRRNELLPHDLLFKSALRDQAVDVHDLLLSNTMGSVHSLQILHGIPVVFDENDRVRSRQRQAQSTNMGRQKQTINAWVRVEGLHDSMSLLRVGTSVQAHVRDRRHVVFEEVGLDDVDHLLHLTEDEHAMLRESTAGRACIRLK